MAGKATKKAEVTTLAFFNPTIIVPAKGDKAERRIKAPRGYQITTSEKYPVDKFNKMLVDLAESNGGQAKLMMEVSINLNVTNSEPLSADGIDLLE